MQLGCLYNFFAGVCLLNCTWPHTPVLLSLNTTYMDPPYEASVIVCVS